jgi:hypothetical protein
MRKLYHSRGVLASLAVAVLTVACDQENTRLITEVSPPDTVTIVRTDTLRIVRTDTVTLGDTMRVFKQVERLANPLAMEVFVEKRFHAQYDVFPPTRDPEFFTDDYVEFVTQVAGRSADYARTIAGVLLGTAQNPGDKLTVFTNRAPGVTAAIANDPSDDRAALVGWLTQVLAPNNTGYGGRKLRGDDVVDKGASAVFGTALGNMNNVSPGLVTDNVDSNDQAPLNEFPYFPPPSRQ